MKGFPAAERMSACAHMKAISINRRVSWEQSHRLGARLCWLLLDWPRSPSQRHLCSRPTPRSCLKSCLIIESRFYSIFGRLSAQLAPEEFLLSGTLINACIKGCDMRHLPMVSHWSTSIPNCHRSARACWLQTLT